MNRYQRSTKASFTFHSIRSAVLILLFTMLFGRNRESEKQNKNETCQHKKEVTYNFVGSLNTLILRVAVLREALNTMHWLRSPSFPWATINRASYESPCPVTPTVLALISTHRAKWCCHLVANIYLCVCVFCLLRSRLEFLIDNAHPHRGAGMGGNVKRFSRAGSLPPRYFSKAQYTQA